MCGLEAAAHLIVIPTRAPMGPRVIRYQYWRAPRAARGAHANIHTCKTRPKKEKNTSTHTHTFGACVLGDDIELVGAALGLGGQKDGALCRVELHVPERGERGPGPLERHDGRVPRGLEVKHAHVAVLLRVRDGEGACV